MAVKRQKNTYLQDLYSSFRVKNMTFTEFCRRYRAATNPMKIRHDLTQMIQDIRLGKQVRGEINGDRLFGR